MDRRELDPFCVVRVGLERIDFVGFLERVERQLAEVLLENGDPARRRLEALERSWFDAPLGVRVEKARDVLRCVTLHLSRGARSTMATASSRPLRSLSTAKG